MLRSSLDARHREGRYPRRGRRPVEQGHDVCNFDKMDGMRHFGGTATEQVNFRHTMAMRLDHLRFFDLTSMH
jgi:hypothetical protein